MINTIEALQGLYVSLGGELTDVANVTTIPEMLTAISTVAAAAASELPAVKTADNGKLLTVVSGKWAKADAPTELPAVTGDDNNKVLTVVNGAWDKAAASGGGDNILIVHVVGERQLDKTYAEIDAAATSGKVVFIVFPNGLSSIMQKGDNYYTFYNYSFNQNSSETWVNGQYFRLNSDNTVTESKEYTFTGTANT